MEALVLNSSFQVTAIIDEFESFIWTDRYSECGDFELYAPISDKMINDIPNGSFLVNKDSEHCMIVETTLVSSDVETGTHITKSGRSLEAILGRRIIWSQTDLSGSFQDQIERLLNENVIAPTDTRRKIPNFIFRKSTDPAITSLEIESQISSGENLLETIQTACAEKQVGFKVVLTEDKKLEFSLYKGVDHSYSQNQNPFVIFSPYYDNLRNSNYQESIVNKATMAFAVGAGEEGDRMTDEVGDNSKTGIDRFELFVDASNLSYENEDGRSMEDEDYQPLLRQRALEELKNHDIEQTFEGDADPNITFVYGKDFYLGDIVQLENEYGNSGASRVTEIVFSHNESGIQTVPTFIGISDSDFSYENPGGHVPKN